MKPPLARHVAPLPVALAMTAVLSAAPAGDDPIVVYKARGTYEDVKESVQMAIEGRGLVVRGVSHVSDMLNRTGPDLGFSRKVFTQAEALEFCSADLSHQMVLIGPMNLTTCPLTIGVYVLTDEPGSAYVAFRRQVLAGPGRAEIEQRLYDLVDGIVREAID